MFVAFEYGGFAVLETAKWNMEVFDFPGKNLAAAWSPKGAHVAIATTSIEVGDFVWFKGDAGWEEAEVESVKGEYTVVKTIDWEKEVPTSSLYSDKPIVVGSVMSLDESVEFNLAFEVSARLPQFHDASSLNGAPPLVSGGIRDLCWSADGGVLLASFFMEGIGAIAAYAVHLGPLSFAPLRLLDIRKAACSPALDLWPKFQDQGSNGFIAAAVWPSSQEHEESVVAAAGKASRARSRAEVKFYRF